MNSIVERVLSRLSDAKPAGNGWSARCPAHDDRDPSLSIAEGDNGGAIIHCHRGCATEAVCTAIGLTLCDLMPPDKTTPVNIVNVNETDNYPQKAMVSSTREGSPKKCFASACDALAELERQLGPYSDIWVYRDANGRSVGMVVRWDRPDGKDIRPLARHADGWHIGAMRAPRPLFELPALVDATLVVVTEGEKAADSARSIGLIATTSAGGSEAAGKTDWRPLAGKEVLILPDNDAAGRKYAESVAGILWKLSPVPVIRIVELPSLPDGGDIVDWIEAHDGVARGELLDELETLADAVDGWKAEDDNRTFVPFPVASLPDPVREFVIAGAEAIGCDASYIALPLLVVLAAAIGNTRRLELKRGWTAPPILWGAIIGESGTAKSPAFRLVVQMVRARQRTAIEQHVDRMKKFESDMEKWEQDVAAWKQAKGHQSDAPAKPTPPKCERVVVSDTTVEALTPILQANPRGLLLERDELAGWIGSFDRYTGKGKATADTAHWLSMYNADSLIVDRKTGIPPTIVVPNAAISIIGSIQPAILRRALGAEHRESGLAARLLLVCPPRRVKRWTEADIDPEAEDRLARLIDRLYELDFTTNPDGELLPVVVKLHRDAKLAWEAYFNSHSQEQINLSGDLLAAWSKLEEGAARLALVVHCVRWAANDPTLPDADILDASSMSAGILLANWFKSEARRVYAILDESDAERDQRRLVEWIGQRGGTATAREVQQGCRWLRSPGAAEAALDTLERAGKGYWQKPSTSKKGGRPTRVFVLGMPSTDNETSTSVQNEGDS